jgi:MOSC domain-containing protein YiiM
MVTSGIFKQPVEHRLRVTALNLDGDEQADPTCAPRAEQSGLLLSVGHNDLPKQWQP